MNGLSQRADIELRIAAEVLLRPLLVEDVTNAYVNGLNDDAVNRFLVSRQEGRYTLAGVRENVRMNFEAEDAILFGIFNRGVHCGNVRLHDISGRRAYIGIAIFDVRMQRKGIGENAIRCVSEYGISKLGLEIIYAGIDDRNIASMRAFMRAGYEEIPECTSDHGRRWKFEGRRL